MHAGVHGFQGLTQGIMPAGELGINAASHKLRIQLNAREKLLFESLPFREIGFNWKFAPLKPTDVQRIKHFLYLVKYFSAPGVVSGGAIYEYPDLFEITIRSGNHVLFKSPALGLKDLVVNYTTHGFFSTLKDGYPTYINVNMMFAEAEQATKEFLESPGAGAGDYDGGDIV